MLDRILIVDDEPLILEVLADVLSREGYVVAAAPDAQRALELLRSEPYALMLCDIRMPGTDGMELLREVRRCHPGTDVLMMTGFGSLDGAIDAMTLGAVDYLTKPLKPREIVARIGLIVRHRKLEAELHVLQSELRSRYDMHSVVASSTHMMGVVAALHRIKDAEEPVVLHGEPGSGRKFTARAIHYNGVRRNEPLIVVDCETPPPGGLESALFGEQSGARNAKRGVLERAAAGSVHIASLEFADRALQVELAQCIATRRWRRRNDGTECALEARLLLSSGAPPSELIGAHDLAPELGVLRNVVTIQIPPLRQRSEDLPGLVTAFLADYSLEHGRNLALAPRAIEVLAAADFPGNVTQLFTVLAHCATISVDGVMTRDNLERSLRQSSLSSDRPISDHLGDREYQLVLRAVQRNSGRLDQAARELGVSRTTLWRRMRKYGIKLALT